MRSSLATSLRAFRRASYRAALVPATASLIAVGACAPASGGPAAAGPRPNVVSGAPDPDPRIGLGAGLLDAEEAIWNLSVVSKTPPPAEFVGSTNSDLAFIGDYAIQGNYNGFQIWDISDPASPALVRGYVCPASQSDVSVYRNLLFVSGEGLEGRLDCGTQGLNQAVSQERLRGVRIFDISDIREPRYVGNVQTCRGSHTHSILVDPDDDENVYVYVSGSSSVRPAEELPGCSSALPEEDPNSALFRIEVIRVPLARPQDAAIVSSPRIFTDLVAPPRHGPAPDDLAEIERARARGAFVVDIQGEPYVLSNQESAGLLSQVVAARGGSGPPTAADSAALREELPRIVERMLAEGGGEEPGPTQCHDITLYPEIGLAGGACEGYGMLIDIRDPVNPRRIAEASDSNFAYWHSATFNNDGDKILFTDEWGGGGQAKCRANDPPEWGANAIFTIEGRNEMRFRGYYKLPAPQTVQENCVAHNGSLIPIPGRDVMVQAWYQGGISVFDWTDPDNPVEIAYFDRGPVNANRMQSGGPWSAYWYNGYIVSSEIARGLDILELEPSTHLSQNEINAARSVVFDHYNPQGQQRFEWPASFALAGAYVDQLERSRGLTEDRIAAVRRDLAGVRFAARRARREVLLTVAAQLERDAVTSIDAPKVRMLVGTLREIATGVAPSS
jgi:hypothetical protein